MTGAPPGAMTTVVITVVGESRRIAPDGAPDATGAPFTVIDAVGSAAVGVTVTVRTLAGALAV